VRGDSAERFAGSLDPVANILRSLWGQASLASAGHRSISRDDRRDDPPQLQPPPFSSPKGGGAEAVGAVLPDDGRPTGGEWGWEERSDSSDGDTGEVPPLPKHFDLAYVPGLER
jgi:hypothetical protein